MSQFWVWPRGKCANSLTQGVRGAPFSIYSFHVLECQLQQGGQVKWNNRICALNLRAAGEPAIRIPPCPTARRLAQAFSRLQNIELARNIRQDPNFFRSVEERVIWRELLELELQEIDEQIKRTSATVGNCSS